MLIVEESRVLEVSIPTLYDVPATANVSDTVFTNASEHPDDAVYAVRRDGAWADVSAAQFAADVSAVAKGLIAAGIKTGERVGLMSKTRYEWSLSDYAIWAAGAVVVPIYETSSAEQVEWIISDSGAAAVIVENQAHQDIVDSIRESAPDLREVWTIDEGSLDALKDGGADVPDAELTNRRTAIKSDDLATIVYTSGTTGRPKGCQLTHRNLLFDSENSYAQLIDVVRAGETTLLFLPLAHSFARIIQIVCLRGRVKVGHTADIKNLLGDLDEFKPSFLLAVPRVFEKVYNSAKQKATVEGKGFIFGQAEAIAIAYSEALDKGRPGPLLTAKHKVADALVFGKLRAALGGRCTTAVSGGAPLGARLGHFFRGIGLTVLEGYGLTETSPVTTANTPTAIRMGTVGQPLAGTTARIGEDGEILIKGEHVFTGYWKNDKATAECIKDGWFHTGDLGSIDADGFVSITGRKKEIIVTAGGKNVAPAVLEDRLRAHALVSQCMVVGDQRPYIGCLITIDTETFPAWLTAHNRDEGASIADLREDAELIAEIQSAVNDANKAVSKAEAIRKFTILDIDFTEESGHLTPSLKLKRNVVMGQYQLEIDKLYS